MRGLRKTLPSAYPSWAPTLASIFSYAAGIPDRLSTAGLGEPAPCVTALLSMGLPPNLCRISQNPGSPPVDSLALLWVWTPGGS